MSAALTSTVKEYKETWSKQFALQICGSVQNIPGWVGSDGINSSIPLLVHISDTLWFPSQPDRSTQLFAIKECKCYFCNRHCSLLCTITLSLTASAGACLLNHFLKTLQKWPCCESRASLCIIYLHGFVLKQPGFSPPATVFSLPFIVVRWDWHPIEFHPYC